MTIPLPPTLTDEALDEYCKFMDKNFPGHNQTREEMAEGALKLLSLVQLTYKPITKKEAKKYS